MIKILNTLVLNAFNAQTYPQISESLKIIQLAKAEARIEQRMIADHQIPIYLFSNFFLVFMMINDKSSSLSASLSLWWHSEIYSKTCSLSNKCLFIFMNVSLSSFQLENQTHLSFVNCMVLNYQPGPNLQTQTSTLSSQLSPGMPVQSVPTG